MIKEITVNLNISSSDGGTGNTKTYKVKRTNRALMFYEDMTKKSIDEITGTLTDMLKVFYCVLVVNNQDFNYTFDEFLDISDDNPEAFADFQAYLISLSLEGLNDIPDTKKKVIRKPK